MAAIDRLLGRDAEVGRLVDAIDRRRTCVIVGEAGIGKTTVLGAAVALADMPVRRGRAIEMLQSEPYLALRQAFGAHLAGEPPEVVCKLSPLLRATTLVVDDVQWCDPDTLAVLYELVAAVPVVVTVRPGANPAHELIRRMTDIGESIVLGPLDDDLIRALLVSAHPGAPGPDVDRWTRSANGNPLAAQMAACNASISDVAAFVAATLDRLDETARDAAARLALHGLPLSLPEPAGRALVAADLAVAGPDHSYELRHPLIAAGVVAALDDGQRVRLNLELARTTSDPARHARHLADAGDEHAASMARAAASRAPTVASRAALLLLAAEHDPDPDDESTLDAADALMRSARYTDAIALLGSRSFADTEQAARADLILAHAFWAETRIDEARAAIERIRVDAGAPSARLVEVLTLECRIRCRIDWEREAALEVGRRAVHIAHDLGYGELAARSALSLAMLMNGDDDWMAELDRAQALVSSDDDLHQAVIAADTLLFGHLIGGDATRCRPIADRMIELTEGVSPAWNGYFRAASLLAAVVVDGNGKGVIAAGPALLDRPLTVRSREMATWSLALALADAGRDAEALPLALRAVAQASDHSARATALFALAETHWLAGRPAEALATARECADLPVHGYPGHVNAALIGVWAATDLGADVDPALVHAVSSQHRNLRAAVLEVEALLASEPADAARKFAVAATLSEHANRRAAARAHFGAGRAALCAGDVAAAHVSLEAAGALCAEHGLVALDGRVRAALRAAGGASAAARGSLPPMRERVLRLVATGATTSDIAASLHVRPSTVESHVRSALHACGSSTRAQAASGLRREHGSSCVLCRTDDELARALGPFQLREVWELDDVPDNPWNLASIAQQVVVRGAVSDDTRAGRAVLAAVRGLQVVVVVEDQEQALGLEAALREVTGVRRFDPDTELADRLTAPEHELLAALAAGASGEEARLRLGFSRRTLSRRLATIRSALDVETTAQAVARWSAATGGP